jgi:hypothetical protein
VNQVFEINWRHHLQISHAQDLPNRPAGHRTCCWNVIITTKSTIRARVLPRVIFLEVRRLELWNLILCLSDIHRGGLLEISLDSLSCPIGGVLPGRLLSEKCMPK